MMAISAAAIHAAVRAQRPVAEDFLNRLAAETADTVGVTRDSYGAGENRAHAIFADMAADLGLALSQDAAANSYATLRGCEPGAAAIVIGSHLDSVPRGSVVAASLRGSRNSVIVAM